MSGPLFSYRRPFQEARHPGLEPEVRRAILARWGADAGASSSVRSPRHREDCDRPVDGVAPRRAEPIHKQAGAAAHGQS
jgi:hypothetical protein